MPTATPAYTHTHAQEFKVSNLHLKSVEKGPKEQKPSQFTSRLPALAACLPALAACLPVFVPTGMLDFLSFQALFSRFQKLVFNF